MTTTDNKSSERKQAKNSHDRNETEDPEVLTLTQQVIEQIKSFIAPLKKQLEYFTWLVLGLLVASQANPCERADTNAGHTRSTTCQ